ncbi:hypothetical protein QBC33DRAFT_248438 [Phialemonium atrogriseum]|uniref:AB hydrolase-1 domain-containing protein n=1 Tax=Phialemonium atrogriseum TaxID=1093897 RepID=A0AAJ0BS48_9PEZI|nr:uncharacterized protein QBC33DRAFT_248438 [Phialemonium atrogriseum]KAK1763255.1 hypothetical protein QBC33DRAFT_248438 [Phialemonium atrogriseum]
MDYSRPLSPNNTITLGLAMYRPAKPKGVLFINTGGSDPVAVAAWQFALGQTTEFSGLTDYDLMMMDVRGTYSSNQLNVSLEVFGGYPLEYPQSEAEFEVFRQASAEVFQSWIGSSSPPGIIQFVGTKEVVRDYEEIRKALGYDKVHFLGESYGSFRAQRYALAFPKRVGHFALDAVVPYGRNLYDEAQDHVNSVNRGMLRADAYCQAEPSCPFRDQGAGSVLKVFQKILANLKQAAEACTDPTDCPDLLPVPAVQQAMLSSLQGQPDFSTIIKALESAVQGDFSALLGDQGAPTVEGVVALPLECGDIPYNTYTYSDFKRALEVGLTRDVTGIGMTPTWQLQLYCSGYPFSVSGPPNLPISNNMLLVTADFDVDAPTEWTTFAWGNARNSALVVRHGDGHVSFLHESQTSTSITKEFLRTGRLPTPRHDTNVSVYSPGMHRPPVSNPYKVPILAPLE